jgi:hypothetical protein
VKTLAAIAFSLLLIVAQTFAVLVPVSGGVSVGPAAGCGCGCGCCVGADDAPMTPAPEAVPLPPHPQLTFLPIPVLLLMRDVTPAQIYSLANNPQFRSGSQPRFLRNCALLI